ncbi:MAG: TetR/AcrR family transcriptional regulator [Coriobacteriales bacterium]|nr:TetR/AcrR family transcriptional regulator [Coriobacteriales bacterium]
MSIFNAIENSFRGLVQTVPFEKITISMICQAANVSRTAFYSSFADKDDLVEKLLDHDVVEPVRELRRLLPTKKIKSAPQLVTEQIYAGFLRHKDYYTRINSIEQHRFIIQSLTTMLSAMNTEILKEYDLPQLEKYYMGYFFAAANAMLISKWIDNGMDLDASTLSSYYNKWTQRYWTQVQPSHIDWS